MFAADAGVCATYGKPALTAAWPVPLGSVLGGVCRPGELLLAAEPA